MRNERSFIISEPQMIYNQITKGAEQPIDTTLAQYAYSLKESLNGTENCTIDLDLKEVILP